MSLDCFFARNITLGVSKHVKEKLLCRWLSSETQESNDTLTNELEESIDRLNATNVVRFVAEDSNRQSMENIIKDVKSKLLIITGKNSSLRHHTDDIYASLNPTLTSRLDVADSGSLVFNEYPEIVAQAISLFLQGFPGYC